MESLKAVETQLEALAEKLQLVSLNNWLIGKVFQAKTGKPLSTLAAVLILLSPLFILLQLSAIVISITCCLIPAFMSFEALETPSSEDDEALLTYWVIYAICEIFSPFLSFFFGDFVLAVLRVATTVLLLHPSFGYSLKVYKHWVEPYLKKYETTIDKKADELLQEGKEILKGGVKELLMSDRGSTAHRGLANTSDALRASLG